MEILSQFVLLSFSCPLARTRTGNLDLIRIAR